VAGRGGAEETDHGWKKRLEDAIKNTSPAASLKAALAPLAIFGEIEIDILMAIVEGQSEEWRHRLHDPAAGFNLPPDYPLAGAVAIYVWTINDPPVYAVVNRELWNPDRRVPGASGAAGIGPRLRACLPFIRFLIDACRALPPEYVYRGEVRRGVKWVYPSPDHHDVQAHFAEGKTLMYFEFKSTSKRQEVMTRPHFLGVGAGPRTLLTLRVREAYCIEKFSFFQGLRSEFEVLVLPLAKFQVVMAQKNIIDPKETESLEKSGFPDAVVLQQIVDGGAAGAAREKAEQERQDAELARRLQQQLRVEEEVLCVRRFCLTVSVRRRVFVRRKKHCIGVGLVCACLCTYTCARAHTHTHTRELTNTHMYTCTHIVSYSLALTQAKAEAETKRKEEAAAKQKAAAEAKVATPHSALLDPQRQQRFRGSLTVYMYLWTYTYMYMYVGIC